ncbi:MAG: hypothetical protein EXR00_03575 [Alphaproteobacteria bacterium]|nr:hypothetical protein [Alphaproteobacteria bacterium]
MRASNLALIVGTALAITTAPAEAAWKSYISKTFGFSYEAPGEVKIETGASRGQIAGPQETISYVSTEDNIRYTVTVINFAQAQAESATILGETHFMYQEGKRVLMDTFARVEPGKDSVHGRKVTVDIPNNGGRSTAAFYFNKGYLIQLEATVLPANGDYQSPDPGRFIDSIAFSPARAGEGATELKLPE